LYKQTVNVLLLPQSLFLRTAILHGDLRLGVVSGNPLLRGLVLFMHLDDGRNLLVLGLHEHGTVKTLA